MTRDEIIRMAREAGLLEIIDDAYQARADWNYYVERFATLVAETERERIIAANAPEIERINAELSEWKKFPMAAMLAAEKAVDAAIALEREACAKVCEDYTDNGGGTFADHESHGYELAQRIRARGQK